MDLRNRNIYNKRVFGKDLTNINQRSKNFSISEKPSQHLPLQPYKIKSRSFSYKTNIQYKDPITHYQSQIMNFVTSIQKIQKYQIFKHINQDMRFILVEWLIEVHESFQLKQQTLYLALIYLNQFSGKVQITKQEYQLAGITCLWIASKYQQIYPPKMKNYVQVTDNSYSCYELKQMEGKIIQTLNFNLTYTTSLSILQAFVDKWPKQKNYKKQYNLTKDCQKNYSMCKYLLQLSNISNLGKIYDINTLVFAAITLSDSIFKTKSQIKCIQQESRPEKQVLLSCFREMCNILQESSKSTKFKALFKKFSQQKYQRVAKIKIAQK